MVDESLRDMTFQELCELKKCIQDSLNDIDLAIEVKAKSGDLD